MGTDEQTAGSTRATCSNRGPEASQSSTGSERENTVLNEQKGGNEAVSATRER